MINRLCIILFFIFLGCNQLIEKTSPLDGIYYILDGWEKFEVEDYNRAHDLFSTVLLNNSTQYYTEAYVGLGWNAIYKANTTQGVNSVSDREYQRDISNQYFTLALEYNNNSCPSGIIGDCSVLCENLLSGRTFNSSYRALEASRQFYDYGLDSTNWDDMIDYSNEVISISDTLFNLCNNKYIFDHDEYVTFDQIRILRAQTFVRLAQFDKAEDELEFIDDLDCDFTTQTVVECLNTLDFR